MYEYSSTNASQLMPPPVEVKLLRLLAMSLLLLLLLSIAYCCHRLPTNLANRASSSFDPSRASAARAADCEIRSELSLSAAANAARASPSCSEVKGACR